MTRHDSAAARATRNTYAMQQLAKQHLAVIGGVAGTLKARARAARMTGLGSVTVQLPVGDALLIADALNETARRRERDDVRAAIDHRKGTAP